MLVRIVGFDVDGELSEEIEIFLDVEGVDADAVNAVLGDFRLVENEDEEENGGGKQDEEEETAIATANASAAATLAGFLMVLVQGNISAIRRWSETILILVEHDIVWRWV